jgi:DNA-directed RNA polymerase specialized sigma24 family protein
MIHLTVSGVLESGVVDSDFDLQAALAELPADQRDAVLRRIVLDESYSAMAGDLACSEQVIRKRVSRGLNALRAYLGDNR